MIEIALIHVWDDVSGTAGTRAEVRGLGDGAAGRDRSDEGEGESLHRPERTPGRDSMPVAARIASAFVGDRS